ncbi:Endonuclease/exonuclease/phosphatase [Crucibulum laeve]|uniref:CCR4-Not complex 3'-5'-exoribonuclease subunit Ccr4 n=1 Tax=Crucibulum laeve TaxID=68775 RepID=A0A5C3MFH2_9AGAR|nr:Endonuclease/exonuclease/phosphatase [Crucibulum laeve]
MLAPGSPASVGSQVISSHWQQQLLKCEMIRSSRSPHHRARASAMASRTVTKSAIPITNPNVIKPPPSESKETDSAPSTTDSPITNHPSSTVGPVAPRLTSIKPPENTWNSLDMGGVNLKNLPPTSGLFQFTFLLNLYLNHNALSIVPPEISKLRYLEVLDLSANNLASIPPELGMLTQLKELYLFDNHLTTLPHELGTLHQLQTMGIEGNPMDATLKALVQKEGTTALVSYLRDTCPVPAPPPERIWKSVMTTPEREALAADPYAETFSVQCYNILCEKYATERLYGYTPAWALAWDYRKELIMTELQSYNSDFLCLQEVDIAQYEEYFIPQLEKLGYEGVYWPKSRYKTMSESDRRQVDGCATFYKSARYQLVEKHLIEFSQVAMQRQDFKKTDDMFNRVLGKDHIAVVTLVEDKQTGTRVIVANAHIHWDPAYSDVKLVQVALLLDEIDKIANNFARYPPRPPPTPAADGENDGESPPPPRAAPTYTDGTKIPLIVCGDYNSVPDSAICDFFTNGTLPANHPDFLSHMYGKYTSEGLRHRLGLKNAYAAPGAGDLHVTNYTPGFQDVLDYIWYSAANLGVNAVLGGVDTGYLKKVVGFPNAHFPSDHVCLVSEFRVKPPRENPPRPPPPVFS